MTLPAFKYAFINGLSKEALRINCTFYTLWHCFVSSCTRMQSVWLAHPCGSSCDSKPMPCWNWREARVVFGKMVLWRYRNNLRTSPNQWLLPSLRKSSAIGFVPPPRQRFWGPGEYLLLFLKTFQWYSPAKSFLLLSKASEKLWICHLCRTRSPSQFVTIQGEMGK